MRIHPLCLLLVVAVPTFVKALAATRSTPCIIGCKCNEDVSVTRIAVIKECDSPLILTKDALAGVSKKISDISFKNVVIKRIEKDAFTGFIELQSVVIEDSSIDSIDPMAFYLPELERVTFTKTTFGESPILHAEYLEELIFNDCKLTEVPNVDNLPALSFLNLANNFIENIDESTFNKVESLEEIKLANNSITSLPPNLFVNNEEFSLLNLDDNPLTIFNLKFHSELELLSLKNCKLSTFDRSNTENLTLLSSLDLSGNEIAILPIDAFELMKDLTNIDLSNNRLVELDDDIFLENTKLEKVILDNNLLEILPKFQTKEITFPTKTFSCKNCSLTSVKGSFDNMKALVTLDLSHNHLKDIDGVFMEINDLKHLFLSNNKITTIGINVFGEKSKLEKLDLSHNPLSPLDPVFVASIPSLKQLDLSNTNLTALWANHNAELPSLVNLIVNKNQLSSITVDDVKIIPKLQSIRLEDNPLSCTQDLYDLLTYLTRNAISPSPVKTHEEIKTDVEQVFKQKFNWQTVLPIGCSWDTTTMNDFTNELDDNQDDDNDDDIDEDDDMNYDDEEYEVDVKGDGVEAAVLNSNGFNLAKASYILSITSVFILTALLVLFVAVVITLLILKRNRAFNMHNGNLPRLKIPLWHTTIGHKKHSGSVYKPLSEDLSGPRTPIINRYEFKQSPQVHNSLP